MILNSRLKLSELHIGEYGTIKSFRDDFLSLKLMEMGCTPGSKVQVLRAAPFNGPIMLKLWNYTLCLRKEEADNIVLEVNGRI